MKINIRELIAAPFTPMLENRDVNYVEIGRYVDVLVEQGVKNVFVNGTTGESVSLTLDERKAIAEKWIEAGKGKLDNVIIHVGTAGVRDSRELAEHAAKAGADAIAMVPPFYYKPKTIKALVDYMEEVTKNVQNVPLYLYHIPEMTEVNFVMEDLLEECLRRLPNCAGLKFSCSRMDLFGRCVDRFGEKLDILYGNDEQLLCALALGAQGGVGSTYNYAGKLYNRILEAVRSGNFKAATVDQFRSQHFIACLSKHGFSMGLHKALMERATGLKLGPPRLPLEAATEDEKKVVFEELQSIGFFNYIQ